MHAAPQSGAFRDQILLLRGRTGLTQRATAALLGVSRQAIQQWEAGESYPGSGRLQGLIALYLERGVFTAGREEAEATALWEALRREAAHHTPPFDGAWFATLRPAEPLTPGRASVPAGAPAAALGRDQWQAWGEAPDVAAFQGRAVERETLGRWLVEERCRVVAVLGLGGIGKTALATRLAHDLAPQFAGLCWRSLRNAPPPEEWLGAAIGALAPTPPLLPAGLSERLDLLLEVLRAQRYLLVLDNLESVLEPGAATGRYRAGYAGYGAVLRQLGESAHQSTVLLTGREAPPELALMDGVAPVRTLRLGGLDVTACQALLQPKGLVGDDAAWEDLVSRYGGNPLALNLVGQSIAELFGGDLDALLAYAVETFGAVFGGMRRLLEEQFGRLSPLEQSVLYWLAIEREPVMAAALRADLAEGAGPGAVLEALGALGRRSLLERGAQGGTHTLQPVVLEYVSERLVEALAHEIVSKDPALLVSHAVVQATNKDYVRRSQERLIAQPLLERAVAQNGSAAGAERRLDDLLQGWRGRSRAEQGFGPGNVVNLLRLLRGDLRGLDLSHLFIRQVYLQEADAQEVSLAGSLLSDCALAEAFDFCVPVAFSPDGRYLAAGTHSGEVCVWRLADRTRIVSTQGHTGAVHGIAWASDGRLLATGGFDGMVKLWEAQTGQFLATLEGHTGLVRGVCFSKDGYLIASGSLDATVKLWEASSRRPLHTLQGHEGGVWGSALSNDGTVKLWETANGSLLTTLEGHGGTVYAVAFTPDGQVVASGGQDGVIRLWEVATGHLMATLHGHTQLIWHIAVSADGRLLVSGSQDGTVRLWDITQRAPGGVCLTVLEAHAGGVLNVAISPDARLIASAGQDGTLRLWEAASGRLVTALQGYARGAWSLAWDGSGQLLANGTQDGTINLWDVPTGALRARFRGHIGFAFGTALSEDGELLATGGFDYTIRFWRVADGLCLRTLQAHEGSVSGIALSPDARLLISGGQDGWIKLWDATQGIPGGEPLAAIQAHAGPIWNIALGGDGHLLASASQDGTVKLWAIPSGQLLATLRDHDDLFWGAAVSRDGTLVASGGYSGRVTLWEAPSGRFLATLGAHEGQAWGLALSRDERFLVSGGVDGAVMLWDVAARRLIARLTGHDGPVDDVAVSPDGRLIASSGQDGAVKLWDPASGACRATLRPDRRYERMDITGLSGVTDAQRAALLALGAVDGQAEPANDR